MSSLVGDRRGAAIVTWADRSAEYFDPDDPGDFNVSVRAAGSSRFGPAERVPIPFPGDTPTPAFDAAGRPAVAYTVPRTRGARGSMIELLVRDRP